MKKCHVCEGSGLTQDGMTNCQICAGYGYLAKSVKETSGIHEALLGNSLDFERKVQNILGTIQSTLVSKNKDYGNSYHKQYIKYGNPAVMLRLEDKFLRLEQLLINNHIQQVSDESIDDTLLDLAGYAILALISREMDKRNE